MNYWLLKSEPYAYSYDDLIAEKKTMWDGIRNYAARNHLRQMKKGDLAFFYHSREGLEIVGICKVVKEYYPDPTAEKGDWSVVEVQAVQRMNTPVSLKAIKATPALQNMALVRISRLSVSPVSATEFETILAMGNTTL